MHKVNEEGFIKAEPIVIVDKKLGKKGNHVVVLDRLHFLLFLFLLPTLMYFNFCFLYAINLRKFCIYSEISN